MPDRVSVIIPCYRQAHLLADAIESVRSQQQPAHEIIVVDDGSPDDTAAVAGRYGVRCVQRPNGGLAAARNTGIASSTGEYLVFLDADDRLLPNHLALALAAFETHPEVALVCGNFRMVGSDQTWTHVHRCSPQPDHYGLLLRANYIAAFHTVTLRREAVLEAGGFDPRMKACEDYDLLLRITRRHPLYCHHQIVAEYRRYAPQLSQKFDLMLEYAMTALRAQRPWIRGVPEYQDAYREGVHRCRQHYGERALWQMVGFARAGDYKRAAHSMQVLLRCYPQGVAELFRNKMGRMFSLRQQPR